MKESSKGPRAVLNWLALPEFLSIVKKITAFESADARHGRSVLQQLKEAQLPSFRAKLPLCATPPTKAATLNSLYTSPGS
jgi:hypothetical protein